MGAGLDDEGTRGREHALTPAQGVLVEWGGRKVPERRGRLREAHPDTEAVHQSIDHG